MSLILAIDVGNSRAKFGLFDNPRALIAGKSVLAPPLRMLSTPLAGSPHSIEFPWRELSEWISRPGARAVIAGPNPGGIETICRDWEVANCPPPVEISRHGDLPLNISVDSPERVGIDRLLNAVAANVLRPVGQPAIVVSSGTATTVDLITGDGVFAGGAILPGFELAGRSLHEHTALLPQISAAELSGLSVPALGKNTQAAIRAGLLYGQVGAVKELIERLSPDESSVVYLTGGNGALLAPFFVGRATFETELALRALARLAGD